MNKAMLMGVSGIAIMFAASAYAGDGIVKQDQDLKVVNAQGQGQYQKADADAGTGLANADAGSSSKSHGWNKSGGGTGGDAFAKGTGGDAYAKGSQDQDQKQYVSGSQTQIVKLPDINVSTPGGTGSGGAAGPGDDGGDGGNTVDDGSFAIQQSPIMLGVSRSAQASFRSRAAADVDGDAFLGDHVTYKSYNVDMNNKTEMKSYNKMDDIKLTNEGSSYGGKAYGGDLIQKPESSADAFGIAGDGGKGGSAYSKSSAFGVSKSDADAKNLQGAAAVNLGLNVNVAHADADARGRNWSKADADTKWSKHTGTDAKANGWNKSSASADAYGKASQDQYAKATNDAYVKPTSTSKTDVDSASKSTAGDGGAGGHTTQKVYSGDATAIGATGATQGGNGGDIKMSFGTGDIGGIGLGTMSGIASINQNSGISATQQTAFSINAHTKF